VLEGSIQRFGNRVRVSVHLADARTHRELWAQAYDRELADVLAIQSEIAKGIAASLQAKLTGREEEVMALKPTNNPEAYDAYLRRSAAGRSALPKTLRGKAAVIRSTESLNFRSYV
jgi:hypothetical protein